MGCRKQTNHTTRNNFKTWRPTFCAEIYDAFAASRSFLKSTGSYPGGPVSRRSEVVPQIRSKILVCLPKLPDVRPYLYRISNKNVSQSNLRDVLYVTMQDWN